MRFHGLQAFLIVSFITTASSSVLSLQNSHIVPPIGLCAHSVVVQGAQGYYGIAPPDASTKHCKTGDDPNIPTIQQVTTSLFRNQYQVKKAAYARGGYYIAKWDPHARMWAMSLEKINGNDDLPVDISFAADHIFEIQMLTIWMNARGKDSSYFGSKLDDLKVVINGYPNGAWITTELNCWKAAMVPDIMKAALTSNTCKNIEQSSLTAYITVVQKDLADIVKGITDIVEKVAGTADAKDFYQVVSKAIECLMGVAKVV